MKRVREFVKRMMEEHTFSETQLASKLSSGPRVQMFYAFELEGNPMAAKKEILSSAMKHWKAVGGKSPAFECFFPEDGYLVIHHGFEVDAKANPRFRKALEARSKARDAWRVAFADSTLSRKDLKAAKDELARAEDRVKKHLDREQRKIDGAFIEHAVARRPALVY